MGYIKKVHPYFSLKLLFFNNNNQLIYYFNCFIHEWKDSQVYPKDDNSFLVRKFVVEIDVYLQRFQRIPNLEFHYAIW